MESLCEKLVALHEEIRLKFPALTRIAIAIYDEDSDLLKTFVHSTEKKKQVESFEVRLKEIPSLYELVLTRKDRVVEDLGKFKNSTSMHSRWLLREGFRSSYTVPLFGHNKFLGFLFFDADVPGFFESITVQSLRVYAELVSTFVLLELAPIYTLRGVLHTVQHITHYRDTETSLHVTRMSQYSYILARLYTNKFCDSNRIRNTLCDVFVEYVFQYAPLHDIGKLGISEQLLTKESKYTDEEFVIMENHVDIGISMIEEIIIELGFTKISNIAILRNIVATHHERYNGSGYPNKLKGTEIPIEGRIVAIADVLDALTSIRYYRTPLPFDEAVEYILDNSGILFDPVLCSLFKENIKMFKSVFDKFQEIGEIGQRSAFFKAPIVAGD
jgi:HD-GYP domain-containing protein (c-di-GMP phosphodiesterase class II)